MTTNDATARDAIAIEISEVAKADSDLHYATSGSMFLDNPEECADAVIAHLREAADDPAVVEAVAKATWDAEPANARWDAVRKSREWDIATDPMLTDARAAIPATLTALLGPRPQGENE